MIVCIAEKPSVARDIARIIGATSSHDGYMEGNGFQVTWTFGHLCTLKEPHDYTPMWRSWSLTSLPMIPERFGIKLIDDQGIKKQFGIIEGLMQKAEQPLYGEYNDQQLGINLDPLAEAYLVRINDESGKAVYEKAINAGNIVALNIDISAYPKGRYTVTVENNRESFTGQFNAQTAGIVENTKIEKSKNVSIYNLQGQRISTLQKGLNIVNGRKVIVK